MSRCSVHAMLLVLLAIAAGRAVGIKSTGPSSAATTNKLIVSPSASRPLAHGTANENAAGGANGDAFLTSTGRLSRALLDCKNRRDWESASSMLWCAVEQNPSIITSLHFNVVISTLARAQPKAEWERALLLLDQMPDAGVPPDAYSYSAAISACSRANQPERALSVFKQCAASATPNDVVFNAMLSCCQRAGPSWRPRLLALFASMTAHGVQPSAWAYSLAIDALDDGPDQLRRALELIDDLERSGGVQPESHCYGAAMRACMRSGQCKLVVELYERMVRHRVERSAHTLSFVLSACAKSPNALGWTKAQEIWRDEHAHLDDLPCEERDERARELFNVHCYTAAAQAYASGGRWREATRLLEQMRARRVSPNAHTYTAVIKACGADAKWETARDLLEQMRAREGGVRADGHVMNAYLQVLKAAGRWEEALALVRAMEAEYGVAPNALIATTATWTLCKEGRLAEADALVGELLAGNGGKPALKLDVGLCDAALVVCSQRDGSSARARQLIAGLGEDAATRSQAMTPRMRKSAIAAFCRDGEWEDALSLLPEPREGAAAITEADLKRRWQSWNDSK